MLIIRKMQARDVDTILDIVSKFEESSVTESIRSWGREELKKWLDDEDTVLRVGEENDKIIANIICRVNSTTKNALIDHLYVLDRYRRRRIGLRLVRECVEELKRKRARLLYALVNKDDEVCVLFLKSLGFKRYLNFAGTDLTVYFIKA